MYLTSILEVQYFQIGLHNDDNEVTDHLLSCPNDISCWTSDLEYSHRQGSASTVCPITSRLLSNLGQDRHQVWAICVSLSYQHMVPFCRQYFQVYFLERKVIYCDWNFIQSCSWVSIDNMPSLVQLMVWHRTDNKSSPELILTQIFNTTCRGVTRPLWAKRQATNITSQ